MPAATRSSPAPRPWFFPLAACAAALLVVGFLAPEAAAQCSACREALRSGGSEGLIRGIFWSWVLMVSVPISFFAMLGWLVLKIVRADRAAQA